MIRRNFLLAFILAFMPGFGHGLSPAQASVPKASYPASYGAVFRTIKVDPDGSGMDWKIQSGTIVYNGERCCARCSLIWCAFAPEGDNQNGPGFCNDELEPVNAEARKIMQAIKEHRQRNVDVRRDKPNTLAA